uniref:uncharacterized protein LOC117608736 isoform X2 n=1 Tax=Osmia lignaria TaxID=473952 RepID=UPI00147967E2|nr:uncharacterized protein LOC117608736 isoform X2 [Osmia lignaria]
MIVIPIVSVLQWPFGSEGCHHCRVGKLLKGHRQSRFPIEYHRRRDDGVRKGRRKHWTIIQAGRDLWKQGNYCERTRRFHPTKLHLQSIHLERKQTNLLPMYFFTCKHLQHLLFFDGNEAV